MQSSHTTRCLMTFISCNANHTHYFDMSDFIQSWIQCCYSSSCEDVALRKRVSVSFSGHPCSPVPTWFPPPACYVGRVTSIATLTAVNPVQTTITQWVRAAAPVLCRALTAGGVGWAVERHTTGGHSHGIRSCLLFQLVDPVPWGRGLSGRVCRRPPWAESRGL